MPYGHSPYERKYPNETYFMLLMPTIGGNGQHLHMAIAALKTKWQLVQVTPPLSVNSLLREKRNGILLNHFKIWINFVVGQQRRMRRQRATNFINNHCNIPSIMKAMKSFGIKCSEGRTLSYFRSSEERMHVNWKKTHL